VLAEWVISVEHRASGQQITWRGMSRCTIRDGLIVAWREYWNPADVAAASAHAVQR
jgi:ketosteroid isomerase-like protein